MILSMFITAILVLLFHVRNLIKSFIPATKLEYNSNNKEEIV